MSFALWAGPEEILTVYGGNSKCKMNNNISGKLPVFGVREIDFVSTYDGISLVALAQPLHICGSHFPMEPEENFLSFLESIVMPC